MSSAVIAMTLTTAQRYERDRLVLVVKDGLATLKESVPVYLVMGQALKKLRDDDLYQETHPKKWGRFCLDFFGFTEQHAGRLMATVILLEEKRTEPMGSVFIPPTERMARTLIPLTAPQRRTVGAAASKIQASGGKLTPRRLQELAQAALANMTPDEQAEIMQMETEEQEDAADEADRTAPDDNTRKTARGLKHVQKAVNALTGTTGRGARALPHVVRALEVLEG